MVLENVIPPIPSELIMPLAASACLGQGQVEFRLVDHPVVALLQSRSPSG
jgi:hypothetical protein